MTSLLSPQIQAILRKHLQKLRGLYPDLVPGILYTFESSEWQGSAYGYSNFEPSTDLLMFLSSRDLTEADINTLTKIHVPANMFVKEYTFMWVQHDLEDSSKSFADKHVCLYEMEDSNSLNWEFSEVMVRLTGEYVPNDEEE